MSIRTVARRGIALLLMVSAALWASRAPVQAGPRLRVGIVGAYASGYNGLLARNGLPREILLDHQAMDQGVLNRYDLILVGTVNWALYARTMEALLQYVRDGGMAVLDSNAFPPRDVVPGPRMALKKAPGFVIAGQDNPLAQILGDGKRYPPTGVTHYLDPGDDPSVRVLARFAGRIEGPDKFTPTMQYDGTPAIWTKTLGRGTLIYSGPALGYALALHGPTIEPAFEAILQYLGKERVEPQLVPEGLSLGWKQSAISMKMASLTNTPDPAAAEAARVTRRRLKVPAGSLPAGVTPLDAGHESAEFNLNGTYLPGKGSALLLLNYWNARYSVSVLFAPGKATLSRTENGKVVKKATLALPKQKEIPFLLKERADTITLVAGEAWAILPVSGLWEGKIGTRGAALADLRFQPVEPVLFSDDFMRTSAEQGAWEVASGQWTAAPVQNPEMGANPFTYSANATGAGWATAGYPFWDDYVFQAAVKPTSTAGMVGLGFYHQDPGNTLLFRARVQESMNKVGDGLQLVRVKNGKERVLAQFAGCLVQGQWYRLSARVRGQAIEVSIDGRTIARAQDPTFSGGMIALHVADGAAKFDDVQVQPANSAPFVEGSLDASTPKFAGRVDVDTWAAPATQWEAQAETPGLFWRRGQFHGDVNFAMQLPEMAAPAEGAPAERGMTFLLAGDGMKVDSGYALAVRPAARPAGATGTAYTLTLLRQGKPVAKGERTASAAPVVAIQRVGTRILGWIDHRLAVEYKEEDPLTQQSRIGFLAEGIRPSLSGLRLSSPQVMDYTFDQAPTDWWVGSGTWEVTNRWSCTPDWSWFGGFSDEVASIWHKHAFGGDVALDFYVGPRMAQRPGKPTEICRDFNAVLCGNGHDHTSGYSFVVAEKNNGSVARLMRNGEVVASNEEFRLFTQGHNRWANVRVEKHGATITLWVEGQRVLQWTDPEPLRSGYLGMWTRDNGVMIPRVTVYYQQRTGELLSTP